MSNKLKYIMAIAFLITAFGAVGQTYVIDSLCVNTERHYRINGEAGSTYLWILKDSFGSDVTLSNPAGTPFADTDPDSGLPIVGSELTVQWNFAGVFDLEAIQYSINGCDTIQQGRIKVFEQPTAYAGPPASICGHLPVSLTDATASNYRGLIWTSSGDGTFNNYFALNPVYTPGPNDFAAETVTLTLRADGYGVNSSCIPAVSQVVITLNPLPNLVIHDPAPICEPETVDLTDLSHYAGSDPSLGFEYFTNLNATIPLAHADSIGATGTYYVKATNLLTSCSIVKAINIVVHPAPVLVIQDPAPVCEPNTIDLSDGAITPGIDPSFTLQYYTDTTATTPLVNYTAVAASGKFYIKATNPATGCFTMQPVNVVIYQIPVLTTTNPPAVCEPETVDLTDPAVLLGSVIPDSTIITYWKNAAASIPLTDPTTVSVTGFYYIKAETPGGCVDIKPVTVIVNPLPLLVINDPPAVCEPNIVNLTDSAVFKGSDKGLEYKYYLNPEGTIPLAHADSVKVSGTFYIKGTNPLTGCFDIKPVNVTINPQPILVITDPEPTCENETTDLTASEITMGSTIPPGTVFTYWADAAATIPVPDETAVYPGTYYIKAETPGKCFDIMPVVIPGIPVPVLVVKNPAPICEPNVIDLTDPALYAGSDTDISMTFFTDADCTVPLPNYTAVNTSGIYYVKATSTTTGCSVVGQVEVVIIPMPLLVITDPAAVCQPNTIDLSDPAIVAGSESPLLYEYYNDTTATSPLTNYKAIAVSGKYFIKATNTTTGCYTIKPVTVTINPQPILVIHNPAPACAPEVVDLTADAIIAGSNIPTNSIFTYWQNSAATISVADEKAVTASGTYYIKVVAPGGCFDMLPVAVVVHPQPVLVTVDPPEVCEPKTTDLSDPSIISASETGLTYQYYSDAKATIPLLNYNSIDSTGTYYIKGTNSIGCTVVKPVYVVVNKLVTPEFPTIGDLCINSVGPMLPIISDNGVVGTWSPSVINTNVLGESNYTFTPAPTLCASQVTITVRIIKKTNPEFTPIPTICQDSPELILPLISNNGIKGTWSPATVVTSTPGTYNFVFTPLADECAKDTTIQVIISPQVNPVFNPIGPLCFNSTPPELPEMSINGIKGTWSPATISTSTPGLSGYTFIPDGGLCVSSKPLQILITDPLVLSETHQNIGYSVDPIGSINLSVTGGYGTHTYLWSNGATTEDISNLPAGTYTVTVTDANLCSEALSVTITRIELMTITAIGTDSPCAGFDGSIQFNFTNVPDGVYDIFYDGGSFPSVSISGNAATVTAPVGLYRNLRLIVNGNSTINPTDVEIKTAPQMNIAAIASASVCANVNGTIDFTFQNIPDGKYDIKYDEGIFRDVQIIRNAASIEAIPGTYTNLHIEAFGCTSNSVTVTVFKPVGLVPTADIIQPTCDVPFGTITVTYPQIGKGYKYQINGGTYQISPVFTNLDPGRTYSIRAINDATNCETDVISATVYNVPSPPDSPTATVMVPPTCNQPTGSIIVTHPLGNQYTYSIDGSTFQKSVDFEGLTEGEHQLTVLDITTTCKTVATISVDSLPKPHEAPLAVVSAQPTCFVATATITVTDPMPGTGYQYTIDGVNFQDSNIFPGIPPGTYQIQTRSIATLCLSESLSLDIIQALPPAAPVARVIQPDCNVNTGTIEIISPLGSQYEYKLDGILTQSSPVFPNMEAGSTHTVEVIDTTTGCESDLSTIEIGPIPDPLAPPVSTGELIACAETPVQTIDANDAIIHVPGIIILWFDAASGGNAVASPTLNAISSVTYFAEAFDGKCHSEIRTPVTLTIEQIPDLPLSTGDITVCEESPIQTLNGNTAISRIPGITPIWYNTPAGGSIIQPTLNHTGSVTFYVEAWNGTCSSNGRTAVTLTIIPKPLAPVSNGDLNACESDPMPVLNANDALQTSTGQNIIWYDRMIGGNIVASPTLSAVGTVTYYAVDFNGTCSSAPRTPVKLTINSIPGNPSVNVSVKPTCVEPTGTVEIITPLGPEYAYNFDGTGYQSSSTVSGLTPGSHVVTTKDTFTGCESGPTTFVIPDVPPKPHIIDVATEDCICYGDSGAINFEFQNVADGTYVIIYLGGRFENVEVTGGKAKVIAPAGNYNVLAIEANGCTSDESWNVTINQPDRINVSAEITEIDLKTHQKGEINITISGGTGQYLIEWLPNQENGFAGATTEDIKDLEDGEYTVKITDENGCAILYTDTIPKPNQPPIATNDEFDAKCSIISGNLMYDDNGSGIDSDPDGDLLTIDTTPVRLPRHGVVKINADGTFSYQAYTGYSGDDTFIYRIHDIKQNYSNPATVTIHIIADFDCDGIPDDVDPDADGDGILNVDEGGLTDDSDGDGHPNWLDIDADNDGIVDNIEGQTTFDYIPPMDTDTDHDGINDAYDPDNGGTPIVPVDTDGDGIPDFLDVDSDGDGVPDYIEGHDFNADGKIDAGHNISGHDFDADGLDDAWDTVNRYEEPIANITGSNAPIQDFDGDGMKDWRDENDDNDQYLTRFEDLNMDGNFANDDIDGDGHPEYLDYGRDCDLFIPEAFSPNGDNIHDYFQIYCIDHYPDAKMYIFDQFGNLLYEKENYGNVQRWGTPDQAWWDGRTRNRNASVSTGNRVIPGTYFYVLKLGNGEVRKSFVFVSY